MKRSAEFPWVGLDLYFVGKKQTELKTSLGQVGSEDEEQLGSEKIFRHDDQKKKNCI